MKRHFEDYKEIKSYSPNTAISHTFRFFSPRKTLFACFVGALPTPDLYSEDVLMESCDTSCLLSLSHLSFVITSSSSPLFPLPLGAEETLSAPPLPLPSACCSGVVGVMLIGSGAVRR